MAAPIRTDDAGRAQQLKARAAQKFRTKPNLRRSFDSFQASSLWGPWFPDSWQKKLWDLIIIAIVVFQSLYIPYVVCFRPPMSFTWFCVDLLFDAVFLADVVITFNMAYSDRGNSWVTDRRAIARTYIKGWFFVDLIASFPFDMLLSSNNDTAVLGLLKAMRLPRLLRLLKLLRVLRFSKLLRNRPDIIWWLQYSKHSNLLRVFRMLVMICVVLHYHSCVFYFATSREDWMGMEDCDWSWETRDGLAVFSPCSHASFRSRYILAYYNSLLLLQGEDIAPKTLGEKCYCAFAILSGSILVAIIFGNVSMLIANLSASTSAYHSKMEKLFKIMNHLELPPPLRRRVIKYYEEIWKQYRSLDGHIRMFVPELNSSLRAEVYVYIRTNLILSVPFLRNCSPDVVKELVMRMTEEVHLKGDYIVHKGAIACEMFCISRGCCEVTNHEDVVAVPSSDAIDKHPGMSHHREEISSNSAGVGAVVQSAAILRGVVNLPPITATESAKKAQLPPGGVGGVNSHIGGPGPARPKLVGRKSKHRPSEKVLKVLVEGDSFGEIALIMECKRNCNVRSSTFVELCILSREDFVSVLSQESYAEDRALMEEIIMDKNKHDRATWGLHKEEQKSGSGWKNGDGGLRRDSVSFNQRRSVLAQVEVGDLKGQVERLEALVADLRHAHDEHAALNDAEGGGLVDPPTPQYSPTNTESSSDSSESPDDMPDNKEEKKKKPDNLGRLSET